MADVFISYKREDRRIAERLSIALEQLGFEVWWDFDLLSGERYRKVIRTVIDQCKAAIVLWSERAVESDFVTDEASHAKAQGKLCPVRIDNVPLPFGFGAIHTEDLSDWNGEISHAGFQAVVRALEARVGRKVQLGGAASRAPEAQAAAAELEAFKAAQLAGNASALRTFVQRHPRGAFASFVRGQIETIEARVTAEGASADVTDRPQVRDREIPRPDRDTYRPPPPPTAPSPDGRSPPWPIIIGAVFVFALIATIIALRPWESRTSLAESEVTEPAAPSTPARDVDSEIEAARQAERERIQREYAAQQAEREEQARNETAAQAAERERLQREQSQRELAARNQADDNAWAVAQRANTVAGYDAYLSAYASGRHASEARTARQRLATPTYAAYDLTQLHPDVRRAAEQARAAESRATAAAQRARAAASQAEASGVRSPSSGYGVADYTGNWAGDRYAGQFSGGSREGVGVMTYGQNASNTVNASRFEGEYARGDRNGVGVYHWHSGRRFAGEFLNSVRSGHGVNYNSDGSRYEGEFANDGRNGYGVLWNSQGRVISAGIWTDATLTTPLSR